MKERQTPLQERYENERRKGSAVYADLMSMELLRSLF